MYSDPIIPFKLCMLGLNGGYFQKKKKVVEHNVMYDTSPLTY